MAISQSIASFFLPNQRRRRAEGGGGGAPTDPALGRVLEGVDDVLEGLNAPAHVAEFIKDDIEDAFTAKSVKSPYYAPGRLPPQVKISPFGLLSNPLETLSEAFAAPLQKSWQELLLEPTGKEISSRIDKEIWTRLFDKVWDRREIPTSLQIIVDRWISRKDIEPQRRGVAKAFLESPGTTFMMAQRLSRYYSQIPGAQYDSELLAKVQNFATFSARAQGYESLLSQAIVKKDWELADNIQKRWQREGKSVSNETAREFNALVKKGGPLSDSQEAQILRFWRARNIHYGTLNFLRTYKEKGAWGVIKSYGWEEIKNQLKYAEFSKFVSAKILGPLGLNRLANFAAKTQRTLKNLTSGLVKKGAIWVLEKLGLKAALSAIGGALGSIVPGAGTAVGAIIGAVVQFAGEVVVEKVGKELGSALKLAGLAVAGAFTFFVLGSMAIVVLLAIVLSNTLYPWEQGGSAAVAQRFIQVKIEACDPAAGCSYKNPLRVPNGQHSISWRVVITNISSQALTGSEFTFSQAQCASAGAFGFDLAPGAVRTATCSGSFTETDEVVSNTVSFVSADPAASEESVGIVVFGNPPVTLPTGWPVASGCITQGPNGSYSHNGTQAIDIGSVSTGTAVRSTFSGVVQKACWESGDGCDPDGYGNYVRVNSLDGSFGAIFAHLASISVSSGDQVTVGQQVGTVDNTGNSSGTHLHYEFRSLPMAEPYIPQDTGSNGSIWGCSGNCGLCF
jgi:hypothetical protein